MDHPGFYSCRVPAVVTQTTCGLAPVSLCCYTGGWLLYPEVLDSRCGSGVEILVTLGRELVFSKLVIRDIGWIESLSYISVLARKGSHCSSRTEKGQQSPLCQRREQ